MDVNPRRDWHLESRKCEAKRLTSNLKPDEHKLLAMTTNGYSLMQIAGRLGLDLEGAVSLKASTLRKLNAHSTADLVRLGIYAEVAQDRESD